jgi:hypothetical protein
MHLRHPAAGWSQVHKPGVYHSLRPALRLCSSRLMEQQNSVVIEDVGPPPIGMKAGRAVAHGKQWQAEAEAPEPIISALMKLFPVQYASPTSAKRACRRWLSLLGVCVCPVVPVARPAGKVNVNALLVLTCRKEIFVAGVPVDTTARVEPGQWVQVGCQLLASDCTGATIKSLSLLCTPVFPDMHQTCTGCCFDPLQLRCSPPATAGPEIQQTVILPQAVIVHAMVVKS